MLYRHPNSDNLKSQQASFPGSVAVLLLAICYGNQDKLWQLMGHQANKTLPFFLLQPIPGRFANPIQFNSRVGIEDRRSSFSGLSIPVNEQLENLERPQSEPNLSQLKKLGELKLGMHIYYDEI